MHTFPGRVIGKQFTSIKSSFKLEASDNSHFLNQRKEGHLVQRQNVPYVGVDLGIAAYENDTLSIGLQRLAPYIWCIWI